MQVRPNRLFINKGRGIFCSKECRHRTAFGDITCPTCGTVFKAYLGTKKYCSLGCRQPWNKGIPWAQETKDKIKATIVRRGGNAGANNAHWDASVQSRKCKTCKRVFRPQDIKRAKAGYGIYCSKVCYQKAKGETVPEKLAREALDSLGELYHPQMVIGFWTVDFLLPFRNTIIEVDGNWWHGLPGAARRDKAKTTYLTNRGFRVIRVGETAIRQDAIATLRAVL